MSSHPLPAANARARLAVTEPVQGVQQAKNPLTPTPGSGRKEKGTPRGSPHFLLLCLFELLQRSDNVV